MPRGCGSETNVKKRSTIGEAVGCVAECSEAMSESVCGDLQGMCSDTVSRRTGNLSLGE